MIPEKGDKSIHVGLGDVREAFLKAGVVPGDTVMFHSSLSSMGTVDDGPVTVFDGVLLAAAPGGTVAMASLWYQKAGMLEKDFDVNTSPAYNGAMCEALRKDPRARRSNHFSHAVAAIGARAEELTAEHGAYGPRPSPWSERAFALSSPWTRFYEWNALYCFIGVTSRIATIKHWIEGEIVLRYLARVPEARRMDARSKLGIECRPGPWLYFDMEKMGDLLEDEGILHRTKIGSATLRAVRTRPLVERSLEIILQEPSAWLPQPFLDWIDSLESYR